MERRKLDFRELEEVVADIEQLQSVDYLRAGNWTLGQICDHLAIFFRGSLDGFAERAPWVMRFFFGKPILWMILRNRGMMTGVKAPASFLPADTRNDALAARELIELIQRFRDHDGDLQPSPLFGKLNRRQWTDLHLIHCAHHLSFLAPHG
jgi:hypothetical protein